jgi:hypothetical protein
MNYKVFFAYQSDIPEEFGKKFIIEAMDQTIDRMKKEGINLELEYGMRKTPGNPLLIEEMLGKSKNADLVLVDLTFTSSKNWFESKKIKFLNKEIRVLNRFEDKLSPNPNALLEMGYAWAQKGYHRTALLMNTAYGTPEDLPVDLKGFRWAIPFNINEINFSEAKQKRKELAIDLYNAIKPAISSDAQYQQERLKPILLRRNWRPRDFNTIYSPTEDAKEKIKKLRIDLENNTVAQRIVGPKNSGKTRLAFELYSKIDNYIDFHENHNKVLYYDLDGGDLRSIESKLIDLRELNQKKILILDNCSLKIHNKVFDEYFYDTNVSLLSIGNIDDGNGATCFLDKDFAYEVIEKISNEIGNPKNTSYIIEKSDGNLRNAILMIGKIPDGEDGLSEDYQIKWQQILGSKLYSVNTLKVLEELSLFTHVGFTDRFENQSEILLFNSEIQSKDELNRIIEDLAEIGIVKITGDFIILEAFIEELAFSRLVKLTTEDLNGYFSLLTKLHLSKQFSNRLVELYKLKGTKTLIQSLSSDQGLFRQETFVNSDQGARILMSLAEIEPIVVLDILNNVLSDKSTTELKDVEDGRRYLVWTLERLVYRPETFQGAANLLFKLSVAENENISNNATYQFCQLYQLYLPATTVSLEERIALLKKLTIDATDHEKAVIIRALDRALMTRGFTRMGGADNQAGEKFEDYRPKNTEEILGYWQSAIELLEELNAFEILISRFNTQVHSGNANAIMNSITKIIEATGSINKELRQRFEYIINNQREISPDVVARIQAILNEYTADTIREQLEYKVALAPYSTYKADDGKIINRSEEKAEEFAALLVNSKDEEWLNELDILLHNEQRLTFAFGKELAKHNDHFENFIDVVIEKMSSVPLEQQNNSLIVGYCSSIGDEEFKRDIIDRFLSNEKIAYHAFQLTRFLTIQSSDLTKLKHLINQNPTYIVFLQYLQLKNLNSDELIEFIEWVKTIEPYGWWIAIDLINSYVDKEALIEENVLEAIEILLKKPGILKGENMHNPIVMHQYEELFKILSSGTLKKALIEFLSEEIMNTCNEISLTNEYLLKDILDILFENYWEIAWGIVGKQILEQDFFGWYNLKELLKKVKAFKDDNLIAWIEEYPKEAPQKVIDFVNISVKQGDQEVWSPLLIKLFDLCYESDMFLGALSSNLHSYSWTGSLVPLLESRKKLLEQISNHEKEEIKSFAYENIKYFEYKITQEKRRDENSGLDY